MNYSVTVEIINADMKLLSWERQMNKADDGSENQFILKGGESNI